ncbi:MAG: type II toxin-antitoxin system RelE family toxin [Stellaceae bacterium]
MRWRLVLAPRAERELDALEHRIRDRIVVALDQLALDPYATRNVKALKGGGYRLRVGDYRVLYELKNDILVILVVRIANRREVYRRP